MYSLKKIVKEIMSKIGSVTMGTTATTITGAIAEHESDISNLNSNLTLKASSTITASSGVSMRAFGAYKYGRIIVYRIQFDITTAKNNTDTIFTGIPNEFKPRDTTYGLVQSNAENPCIIGIKSDGTIVAGGSGLPVKQWYTGTIVAISAS